MLEKINDGTKPNFAKRNCSEDHVLLYPVLKSKFHCQQITKFDGACVGRLLNS